MSAKYDRHISIINYLRRHSRTTYAYLASEFSISIHTIKRDISELLYHFPIETYQGRNGGVEMNKGFVLNGFMFQKRQLEIIDEALKRYYEECPSDEILKIEENIRFRKPSDH